MSRWELGVYLHVPFCLGKCFYCDFYSVPVAGQDTERFLKALLLELEREVEGLAARRKSRPWIKSLYIGGGTPTCLPTELLTMLLERAQEILGIKQEIEITVEANPGTLQGNKLYWMRRAGANRLSLGVQSLHPGMLKILGRRHTVEETWEALGEARKAGFENIGIDLLLGLPGQTASQWRKDLQQVAEFKPEHVSAYLLSVEPGTQFYQQQEAGLLKLPDEDTQARLYEETVDCLTAHGYRHYEISNFALPGYECRHNLIYWENEEYLGAGPAAWSFLREGGNAVRRGNMADVETYCRRIEAGKDVAAAREEVTPEMEMAETVILGLRKIEGVNRQLFRKRFGKNINEVYGRAIEELQKKGLLVSRGEVIKLSTRGLLLANQVWLEFLPPHGVA